MEKSRSQTNLTKTDRKKRRVERTLLDELYERCSSHGAIYSVNSKVIDPKPWAYCFAHRHPVTFADWLMDLVGEKWNIERNSGVVKYEMWINKAGGVAAEGRRDDVRNKNDATNEASIAKVEGKEQGGKK